mmetsp:Transcript_29035/g.46955  ORF Transcript_29035/g.46955 Transcript_29035/m.46955 type:complete len:92 (+) Transcript_29035:205-480(+)
MVFLFSRLSTQNPLQPLTSDQPTQMHLSTPDEMLPHIDQGSTNGEAVLTDVDAQSMLLEPIPPASIHSETNLDQCTVYDAQCLAHPSLHAR